MSRVITPSFRAASATKGLIVEHGSKPAEKAIFWLTMERMRPFRGIHCQDGAFFVSQGIHCNIANHRIVVGDDIILRGIGVLDHPCPVPVMMTRRSFPECSWGNDYKE